MNKMTKKILLAVAIITLVLTMASCNFGSPTPTGTTPPAVIDQLRPAETTGPEDIVNPETDWEEKEAFCEELTKLSKNGYSKIELNIATTSKGITLNSQFVLNEKEVEYSIEKLTSFKTNEDGSIEGPASFKETQTGTAMLSEKNDTIIFDGEIIEITTYHTLVGSFNFVPENVGNFQSNNSNGKTITFEANDASAFLGTNIAGAENMVVTVSYSKDGISDMTIQYSTETAQVVMTYAFTK